MTEEEPDEPSGVNHVLLQSEVHVGIQPKAGVAFYETEFEFPINEESPPVAEPQRLELVSADNDPPRKRHKRGLAVLSIRHAVVSFMPDVGLQVWPSALLLAEYIVANARKFQGARVLELGCGTGLAGLVMALVGAPEVMVTDYRADLLENAAHNVTRNASVLSGRRVMVRQLDLFDPPDPSASSAHPSDPSVNTDPFALAPYDVNFVSSASVVIATDLVFGIPLVDVLFDFVKAHLSRVPDSEVLLVLERRVQVAVEDLSRATPSFDYLMAAIQQSSDVVKAAPVPLTFPQFLPYVRGPELELWRLTAADAAHD